MKKLILIVLLALQNLCSFSQNNSYDFNIDSERAKYNMRELDLNMETEKQDTSYPYVLSFTAYSICFLALSYLVCNLLAMPFLALYYLDKEKKMVSFKEFAMLLLLPAAGIGKWRYNRDERAGLYMGDDKSKKWYLYRDMYRYHFVYLALVIMLLVFLMSITTPSFGVIIALIVALTFCFPFIIGIIVIIALLVIIPYYKFRKIDNQYNLEIKESEKYTVPEPES